MVISGTPDLVAEHVPEIQYAFVQMLTEHLVDCRRAFGGDLDAMLVLAVIGQNHIKALLAGDVDPHRSGTAFGMSASRIADVTEIPRETVRRKLVVLEKRGWVTQNSDAVWVIAGTVDDPNAGRDLVELSQSGIGRALRLHADMTRILAKSQGAKSPKMGM